MKRLIFSAGLALAFLSPLGAQTHDGGYPIQPVPFTSVKVQPQTFWGQRLEASRTTTIPLAFSKCESEGRYTNFVRAANQLAGHGDGKPVKGLAFDDTDVYKTIEGASYLMQTYPDKKLDKYIDSVLQIVAKAQEPDGYLYTARTMNPQHPHGWAGSARWEKVEDLSHEFYDLGHMIEGAVAHYQATGKKTFLDIARRYADCVCKAIGPNEGQIKRVPGHQIAEMALCKLYLTTGDKKYLDEAKFFLDTRGKTDRRDKYSQAHQPVVEQSEAVGHAVRAAYMYSGMADVAALTGDKGYIDAIDRIWDNIVGKKLYITGGIGATSNGEAFGDNYELPNMSAYCETCAAIGNVYVNYRLFLLHGEAKYYDVLERSLYNGVISGVAIDGGGFFYPNPLESMGQHQRQPWFGCACCPSNICRFIPSLPGYIYATKDDNLYVNLYAGNSMTVKVGGKEVALTQTTEYPYKGDITITIDKTKAGEFDMKVRIPGWVRNEVVPSDLYAYADNLRPAYTVSVNGEQIKGTIDKGYLDLRRLWKKGDKVEIHFDMPARLVSALEDVEADRGRVAIERGPLVYCAEWPDNDFDLGSVMMLQKPTFTLTPKPELLNGIYELSTKAQTLSYDKAGRLVAKDVDLTLIPYYAWCHRGSGRMMVWLPQQLRAVNASTGPTIASEATVEASTRTAALGAVNNGMVPKSATDRSVPYYHWWPKQGGTEWISYTFKTPTTLSASSIYWYDDRPWGGCQVPKAWRLLYKDGEAWKPVPDADQYGTRKGALNTVHFSPITTTAVRLEVDLPEDQSAGLYDWSVE